MNNTHSEKLICAPDYPLPSYEIIRRLSAMLQMAEDPRRAGLDQQKVAELIGIPKGTLDDWLCHEMARQPIKRFLSGLERLSEADRISFIRSLCRHCPRLEDPRISHDKEAVAVIKTMLQRDRAITLITGSGPARTYLTTAIGNSFAARYSIVGFDMHPPVDFVPVPGVLYPSNEVSADRLPLFFAKVWPQMARIKNSIILLNGVWQATRPQHDRVLNLAANNHVLIADDFAFPSDPIHRSAGVNVIRVECARTKRGMP